VTTGDRPDTLHSGFCHPPTLCTTGSPHEPLDRNDGVSHNHAITAVAMKFILTSTSKRLAALLRLAHVTARANADRLVPARRPSSPSAADLVRVPAYMRRRRLGGRVRGTAVQRP